MHPNEKLIRTFYDAFERKDYQTMQEAYHSGARFSDLVFQDLSAAEVKAMWKMLVLAAKDLKVSYSEVSADDVQGECRWEALYTFTDTGRKVHNKIRAKFEFRDGKIFRHTDSFNFWRWSRMALGMAGWVSGWSPFLLHAVRTSVRRRLKRFMKAEGSL
jgi:ketosteroid isomerase-like protein